MMLTPSVFAVAISVVSPYRRRLDVGDHARLPQQIPMLRIQSGLILHQNWLHLLPCYFQQEYQTPLCWTNDSLGEMYEPCIDFQMNFCPLCGCLHSDSNSVTFVHIPSTEIVELYVSRKHCLKCVRRFALPCKAVLPPAIALNSANLIADESSIEHQYLWHHCILNKIATDIIIPPFVVGPRVVSNCILHDCADL